MPMITYGEMSPTRPEGFVKRLSITLCWLNQWTPDGRRIESEGFGTPYLPATIKFLETDGPGGHEGAAAAGRLDMVQVFDSGEVVGFGWAEDSEVGNRMVQALQRKTVKGNSVDLRDVEVAVKFPDWFGPIDDDGFELMKQVKVKFTKARLGATTIVMEPAFGHASASVEDDDEIRASFTWWDAVNIEGPTEVTAAAKLDGATVPWDDFYTEESPVPHKILVDADRRVFGHLGRFGVCHEGLTGRCEVIPRSPDNYAKYCQPGPLSDRGTFVPTGPISLLNGHPDKPLDTKAVDKAYGGAENAWADVRVVDGKFGPWLSGRVRPHVTDEQLHIIRGSRISGHWKAGHLYAIVCVNTEGHNIPAGADVEYSLNEDGEFEMVASFSMEDCGCEDTDLSTPMDPEADLAALLA